jgi:hypothetical protein
MENSMYWKLEHVFLEHRILEYFYITKENKEAYTVRKIRGKSENTFFCKIFWNYT